MKYQSKLAIMVIIIALFACVYANQLEYSHSLNIPKTENKLSCQAVTLAYASCEEGDDACIEYKSKRFNRKCPDLTKSLATVAKETKKAEKFSEALHKLKTAADKCPLADKLSKKINSAIKALKTNPKLVDNFMKKVGEMSTKVENGVASSRKQKSKKKLIKKKKKKAARKANATNAPQAKKSKPKKSNAEKSNAKKSNAKNPKAKKSVTQTRSSTFLELAATSTATTSAEGRLGSRRTSNSEGIIGNLQQLVKDRYPKGSGGHAEKKGAKIHKKHTKTIKQTKSATAHAHAHTKSYRKSTVQKKVKRESVSPMCGDVKKKSIAELTESIDATEKKVLKLIVDSNNASREAAEKVVTSNITNTVSAKKEAEKAVVKADELAKETAKIVTKLAGDKLKLAKIKNKKATKKLEDEQKKAKDAVSEAATSKSPTAHEMANEAKDKAAEAKEKKKNTEEKLKKALIGEVDALKIASDITESSISAAKGDKSNKIDVKALIKNRKDVKKKKEDKLKKELELKKKKKKKLKIEVANTDKEIKKATNPKKKTELEAKLSKLHRQLTTADKEVKASIKKVKKFDMKVAKDDEDEIKELKEKAKAAFRKSSTAEKNATTTDQKDLANQLKNEAETNLKAVTEKKEEVKKKEMEREKKKNEKLEEAKTNVNELKKTADDLKLKANIAADKAKVTGKPEDIKEAEKLDEEANLAIKIAEEEEHTVDELKETGSCPNNLKKLIPEDCKPYIFSDSLKDLTKAAKSPAPKRAKAF